MGSDESESSENSKGTEVGVMVKFISIQPVQNVGEHSGNVLEMNVLT
jgi:hypothetical protein